MAIQIFIEPELENLHENAEEWYSICESLGLDKQLQKTGKIERVGNPYQKVDPRSERVFKMLCPASVSYKDYEASTIPLEILQEISRCEKNGWFKHINVWYDDKSPDPFLIGYDDEQTYRGNKFLIARWGDEIVPFEQLISKAIARFRDAYKRALDRLIMDCELREKDVDLDIKGYIDMGDSWNGFEFPKFQNPIK